MNQFNNKPMTMNVKLSFKVLVVLILLMLPSVTYTQSTAELKSLWNKAKAETLSENFSIACNLLHQIIDYTPADTAYIIMSQIWLANIYGNTKDLKKMDLMIEAIEDYVRLHSSNDNISTQLASIKTFRHTLDMSVKSFEEDLIGVWVSDWADEKNQQPYWILCVNNREAHISPYSKLAEINGLYRIKNNQFVSQKKMAGTKDITIKGNENYASFYFGDEKYKKGNVFAASVGIGAVEVLGDAITKTIQNSNQSNINKSLYQSATDIGTTLLFELFQSMSVSEKNIVTYDILLQRLFPGCAEVTIIENHYTEWSDGRPGQHRQVERQCIMYKLYPEYNITFATGNGQPFGEHNFLNGRLGTKVDIGKVNKKNSINKQSYDDLFQRVTESYTRLFAGKEGDVLLSNIRERLDFGIKGFWHLNTKFANGVTFKGMTTNKIAYGKWTYTNGDNFKGYFIDGKRDGDYQWANGNIYNGEWKNNLMHGIGYHRWANGDEYTGEWKNNIRDGYGYCKWGNNLEYNGNYKNNLRHGKGRIVFTENGITKEYDGEWKNDYWDGKGHFKTIYGKDSITEYIGEFKVGKPHGQGEYKYIGSVRKGKWENGILKQGYFKYANGISKWKNGEKIYAKYKVINGDILEGKYLNNNTIIGKIIYTNGDIYDGQFVWKKEIEKWVREGKGTMKYANGKTISGKWENNEIITNN